MIRRRRPNREIAFSFDSFLDVVANVVGIIIRLILVVWVGARSYHTVQFTPDLDAKPAAALAELPPLPADPLEAELEKNRLELAKAQARLLEQLRQFQQAEQETKKTERALLTLQGEGHALATEKTTLETVLGAGTQGQQSAVVSLGTLRQRGKQLAEEIKALEKQPPVKQTLRYRTPVSRPVQSEEFMFECKGGRITFIDIGALLTELKHGLDDKGQLLKSQWQINDVAGPIGAFRLRYTVERLRGTFDAVGAGVGETAPERRAQFRFGVSEWLLEPVALERGEPVDVALQENSEFRRVADGLDPQQAAVTFWVYPDSFAIYRRLRDYLYDRDIVVAGRPLPDGVPIRSTRNGSVSRGQ